MLVFIDLLKSIATLLITNSHYDSIYPWPALATGGALGNTIFFMVSGYLAKDIDRQKSFASWYGKKVVRILPKMLLCVCLIYYRQIYPITSLNGLSKIFIHIYWFVTAILLYYALFYIIVRYGHIKAAFSVLLLCYAGWYIFVLDTHRFVIENTVGFKSLFYFPCMLFGYVLCKMPRKVHTPVFPLGFFVLFYAIKLLAARSAMLMRLQFLQHVALFLLVYTLLDWMRGEEERLTKLPFHIKHAIHGLASLTLEIYLVQQIIMRFYFKLSFPLSFLAYSLAILAAALFLKQVGDLIVRGGKALVKRGKE